MLPFSVFFILALCLVGLLLSSLFRSDLLAEHGNVTGKRPDQGSGEEWKQSPVPLKLVALVLGEGEIGGWGLDGSDGSNGADLGVGCIYAVLCQLW